MMALKEGGSAMLVAVSVSSLFLALSVYYIVDNIARPTDGNNMNENENESPRAVNPLTEILYNQLFQKKPLEICPLYFKDVCRWDLLEDKNETDKKINVNTTNHKQKHFNIVIRRSCQIFGVVKYQDVCFYVGESLEFIEDSARIAQISKGCAYVNDKGYPCVLANNVKPENQTPKNVCLSDSETFKNVVTHRCRVPESLDSNNDSNVIPLEDIIYDGEINTFRNGDERNEAISSTESEDGNQQFKSGGNKTTTGTNATTVVCHILLAALLIVSASVALYEVCRDRLSDKKLGQHSIIADGRITGIGNRSSSLDSRRCSLVDLTMSRHVRRESVQHSAVQQQANLQQPSNSSATNMQIKLLGARPPPLLRRSSFPVHIGATASERTQTPSGVATPVRSLSRRTSVDGSEEDSSPDLAKRRVRFLRRH